MFEQAFQNIDDVLWKEAGCTTELDYTEQTSRLLFLKYLDGLEQDRADEVALEGKKYTHILAEPYRWEEWAAPRSKDGRIDHMGNAGRIDPATFDLSVKNPNGGEAAAHRSPEDIMDEIAALNAESAAVLETIRRLL